MGPDKNHRPGIRVKVKKIIAASHKLIYAPFAILACWSFSLRYAFFGAANALHYLKSVHGDGLVLILRLYGAKVGRNCDIQPGLTIHNSRDFRKLEIGNNCHIGKDCFFDLRDSIIIGNNVVISMCCRFVTHIDMTQSILSSQFPAKSAPIFIGDDSYLGIGTTVLMGVEIGSRVLVGANSLVNDSFPDDSRVAGTPCCPIDGGGNG